MRAARRAAGTRAGFTLVELLAVVAILALVLFIVVPGIDGLTPQRRLLAAGRRLASTMDVAQAMAIGDGKEIVLAYDLDRKAYWIILPPKPTAPTDPTDPSAKPPPWDDPEHGLAPPPAPKAEGSSAPSGGGTPAPPPPPPANYDDRETLSEDAMPDGVELFSVTRRERDERTSGRIYIPFSRLGDDGSHVVGLRLAGPDGQREDGQLWVKYSSLTRTFELSPQKLEWPKASGD